MRLLRHLHLYLRRDQYPSHQRTISFTTSNPSRRTIGVIALICVTLGHLPQVKAADPNKVIRLSFPGAETGFDPAATTDLYSAFTEFSIFEALYSYDYLARPAKLVALTATALPTISSDGKTYTIHIKKGIYFQDDPAFQGKKRELTSYDYAYSLKRLLDPMLASPNAWLIEGKLKGMEQLIASAKKNKRFDYDAPVEGIQTPDRYTLVLKLNNVDYNLPLILAHGPAVAVAREVIEKYKDNRGFVMAHPVGTGAYRLTKWTPGSRIRLSANPNYRGYIWDFKSSGDPDDAKIIAQMKGKKMPQVGVVDIQIMEDGQSQWLAFKQKQLDYLDLADGPMASIVIKDKKLIPDIAKDGIHLSSIPFAEMQYVYMNMQDPVLGGLSPEKIALRRAILMSFSKDNYNRVVYKDLGIVSQYPVATTVAGYDASYKSPLPYSVAAANLLLDRYNYKIGPDGYRRLPNGQPLTINYAVVPRTLDLAAAEFWKRSLDKIHIRFNTQSMLFPDFLKATKSCKVQMSVYRWIADYPDADNFFMLFNGRTTPSEVGCASIPAFDQRYLKTQMLPNGPERTALYQQMTRIMDNYAWTTPLIMRQSNVVVHDRVQGYKAHPMTTPYWFYLDVAKK